MDKAKRIAGQHTGATVNEDGTIELAPLYRDEFARLSDRDLALRSLQQSTLAFCRDELIGLISDQRRLWDRIITDLNLDGEKFDYSYSDGKVTPKPKAVPQTVLGTPSEAPTGESDG